MPILFSAVANDKIVLAKFASCEGNFTEIADAVLSKVPAKNEKVTYFHGHYLFHYVTENHCLYFCITDKTCQRSRAFLFLNQLRRRFNSEGKAGLTRVLADEMYRYSEDYSTIVIHEGELDELNRIGVRSSEEILGEKLLLVKNVNNLSYSTITTVCKTPEEAAIHDNMAVTKDQTTRMNNLETTVTTGIPLPTYEAKICSTNNDVRSNDKSKSHIKIVTAMILIVLSICMFAFMPFGQVFILAMSVIFVLLR